MSDDVYVKEESSRDGGIRKVNLVNIVKCMWFAALGGGKWHKNLKLRTAHRIGHVDNQGTYNTMHRRARYKYHHGVGKAKK